MKNRNRLLNFFVCLGLVCASAIAAADDDFACEWLYCPEFDVADTPVGSGVLVLPAACYSLLGCTYNEVIPGIGTLTWECSEANCSPIDFVPQQGMVLPPDDSYIE